jgi:glutamate racemase
MEYRASEVSSYVMWRLALGYACAPPMKQASDIALSAQRSAAGLPIGVFDSGVGGLTVLRQLELALPHEDFLYLGDTARLPYGTKSPDSIRRYSLQAAAQLRERGVKGLVVACNTASAVALEALRAEFAPMPVLGVVEPGAQAACAASRSGSIAVIATESTVRGRAYEAAIHRGRPDAHVVSRACPLFVALAEEGWVEGPVVEGVVRHYLEPLFGEAAEAPPPDTLVLGCTHFPVLAPAIAGVLGDRVGIVDSAWTTARALVGVLERAGLRAGSRSRGSVRLLATDGAERFARVGSSFLGRDLAPGEVEIVDLAPGGASPPDRPTTAVDTGRVA